MSIQFRNSRLNRNYLDRVETAYAPDRAAVPANGSAAVVRETVDGPATPAQPPKQHAAPHPAHAGHAGHHGSHNKPATAQRPVQKRDRGASVLEITHPDIVHAISLLWGYPEMNAYFDRLWMADDSHGPIDPEAMSELMVLSRVHQMLVPQRPGRNLASLYGSNRLFEAPAPGSDPWSDVPPRR